MAEWQIERVRERERVIFHPLIHSPYGYSGLGCARLKPEAWNSIPVSSHVIDRGPSTWIICCFLQSISRHLYWKLSSGDSNWHSNMACQRSKYQLNPLHHDTGPREFSLKRKLWKRRKGLASTFPLISLSKFGYLGLSFRSHVCSKMATHNKGFYLLQLLGAGVMTAGRTDWPQTDGSFTGCLFLKTAGCVTLFPFLLLFSQLGKKWW